VPLPPKAGKKSSKAKKKAVAKETMHELAHGSVNAPSRKSTSGAQRQKQNVAIMLERSGQGRKKKKSTAKRPRNVGRA
jgi:hypothetical protein